MLKIRNDQMRAFGHAVGLDRFEDEAVPYFQNLVPRQARMLQEAGLRRVIRLGVERAAAYGISNPGLLRFYIELMFCFGSQFDIDPLLPWAGEVLRDSTIGDELNRSNRLYDAMKRYLDTVAEPGTTTSMKALQSMKDVCLEDCRVNTPDFQDVAVEKIRRIYPERCSYLGELRLRQTICGSSGVAASCGMAVDRGVALTIGLQFIIGYGFATDPSQPWIQAILQNSNIATPEQRTSRMEHRLRIYLDEELKDLEQSKANVHP